MHLFIFYLFVLFVNVVDLWDPEDYRVHDRAAETAKLIDIVQKADKFEVKFPLKPNDFHKNKNTDDADILKTMKLLQKNYDVNRKFNILPKKERLQYISNPEVLETYKNLRHSYRQQAEAYDDLDNHGSTLRSYFDELTNSRYFRTNDKNGTERESTKNNDNDAADTKEVNKRRHIGEKKESESKESSSDSSHSPENSEEVNKYNEAFNLVKPIVSEMLSKYVVKDSKEKRIDNVGNNPSNNIAKIKLTKKKKENIQSQSNDNDTQTEATTSKNNKNNKRFKKLNLASIEGKVTKSLTSSNSNIKSTKNSQNKNYASNDRNIKNTKKISNKVFNIDPTITIEHNASEEINRYPLNQNHNSVVIQKIDLNKHYNENVETKNKKTKIKEEIEQSAGRVSMEEHVINWSDYDENKSTNKEDPNLDDEKKRKKNKYIKKNHAPEKLSNKYEDNKNKKKIENDEDDIYKSKVSTKRKGDWDDKNDNWDQNYDDKKDDTTLKKKNIDWDKKGDSQKSKDWKPKNKRIDKDDYDLSKKKDKWSKKDDNWNKSEDKYDKKDDDWNINDKKRNKKDDDWNKKETKGNKNDDDYDIKEEKQKIKKKKWKDNDDNGNLKRDSAWDSVGTNKKQSSGWGSYDSFKNVLEEKKKVVIPLDPPKPKMDIKLPKPSSWDSYDRESRYKKPKKPGRMGLHRTPIPIVGKRPLYAD